MARAETERSLPRIPLPDKFKQAWQQTIMATTLHCPAFTHVFYSLMNKAEDKHVAYFTTAVPVAATDGSAVIINPESFFPKFTLRERVFIVCHEILHAIFKHMEQMHRWKKTGKVVYPDGTSLPYDSDQMQVAMDMVINAILVNGKVGDMPKDACYDKDLVSAFDSVFDSYKKIYKKRPGAQGGQPGKTGGFDLHLAPGTTAGEPSDAAADEREREDGRWRAELKSGVTSAQMQGRLPGDLGRLLGALFEPQVDWTDRLKSEMARKLGSGSYNWKRPDRRLIVWDMYAPSRSGAGCGTVVVGTDTSGSINNPTLQMFFSELAGILDQLRPERLIVMWCDARVHRIDEVEDMGDLNRLRSESPGGGGGTSFIPVFQEIEKQGLNLDGLIYLTDGQGAFPQRAPNYPVIWGSILEQPESFPFGEVIMIPKQAEQQAA